MQSLQTQDMYSKRPGYDYCHTHVHLILQKEKKLIAEYQILKIYLDLFGHFRYMPNFPRNSPLYKILIEDASAKSESNC